MPVVPMSQRRAVAINSTIPPSPLPPRSIPWAAHPARAAPVALHPLIQNVPRRTLLTTGQDDILHGRKSPQAGGSQCHVGRRSGRSPVVSSAWG